MTMRKIAKIAALVMALGLSVTAAAEVPQTPADHLAMAKRYQDKAASYRQDATYHREMLADYKRSAVAPPKGTSENPWVTKMARHCQAFIDDAERLAADADRAAEYHRLRAKELQGQ